MLAAPHVRDAWLVHEDASFVVLDKPAGMPCLPQGEPSISGDLATRLARHFRGGDVKTPDPLDRDASGLVVFARTKATSAALARATEEKRIRRRFVAVVVGERVPDRAELAHRVAKEHGRFAVVKKGDRRAFAARTRLRVIERASDRALVSLEIAEGRAAQLRVQLAAEGFPIAGDRGGAHAARLMLHAQALDLALDGRGHAFETDVPDELRLFLESGASAARSRSELDRALTRAIDARWALVRSADDERAQEIAGVGPTSAFRLLHEEGDGVPGLAVDVYGAHLVAHLHEEKLALDEGVVLDALEGLGADGVYVKRRPRQANELVDTRREEVAPAHAVRGRDASDEIVVLEDGVPYIARLGDGLSTGIFLDQRENRARVRGWAKGASVLNLFAYTCPFTVAAAVGGAKQTVSVDASGPALEWGERNVANARATGEHRFVKGDAFEALAELGARGERFDLVIVDPPTYSTTRASRWKSGKDWEDLGALAVGVVETGGRLLACSNDRRMTDRAFLGHLERAAERARRRIRRTTPFPPPPEHRTPEHALKTILCELD